MATTLKNIYYWGTPSFSGTGQFNEGPFHIGAINKLIRARVSGAINYQGSSITDTSVFGNFLLWALSIVGHGSSALDIILAGDSNQFLIRQQTRGATVATWAPNTDTAAVLASLEIAAEWQGQLNPVTSDIDAYLSFAPPFGGSTSNFNTYGTVEFWYA